MRTIFSMNVLCDIVAWVTVNRTGDLPLILCSCMRTPSFPARRIGIRLVKSLGRLSEFCFFGGSRPLLARVLAGVPSRKLA